MILYGVSFVVVLYCMISFVLRLPVSLWFKVGAGLLLLFINLKYYLYRHWGEHFFAPDLPRHLLLVMEALYAATLIFFVLLLIYDAANLVLWALGKAGFPLSPVRSSASFKTVLLSVAVGLGVFGVWQAVKVPDVRTREIALPGLPAALDGVTLVQLSDIHIGPQFKGAWLGAVVERVNALEPDVVVITGDFVDGTPQGLREDLSPLRGLQAKHGVFGVTGNHEYYFDVNQWLPVFAEMGVEMLSNEHRVLHINNTPLVLVGLPDSAAGRFGMAPPDVEAALAGAPQALRILLAHQPQVAVTLPESTNVDLQLSGHTHGGLISLIKPIIAAFNEGFVNGEYALDGMKLFVSPGTGLWNGFSCRIGVPSEITLIILRSAPASSR